MTISFKHFNKQINEEQLDEVMQDSKAHQIAKEHKKRVNSASVTYNKDGSATVTHRTPHPGSGGIEPKHAVEYLRKTAGSKGTKLNTTVSEYGTHRTHITNESVSEEALKGNQDKLDVDKDGKIEKSDLKKLRKEETVEEEKMTDAEMSKREKIVKGMKKSYKDFVAKYGSRAKDVMYATATKRAMGEEYDVIEEEDLEEAKKDDYWDFKDLKDEPKSTTRKVAGTRYGGSAQKDEPEDDDDDDAPKKKVDQPKRGRGRPKGAKSGARQQGNNTKKSYGGLTFHSLNLPNSNK